MSPRIETDPGAEVREAWIYLTPAEAIELAQALSFWDEEATGVPFASHFANPS